MKLRFQSVLIILTWLVGSSSLFAQSNLADLVAAGNLDQALLMIDQGADVNALQSDGTSALLYAIYQDDLELVTALVMPGPMLISEMNMVPTPWVRLPCQVIPKSSGYCWPMAQMPIWQSGR